MLRCVPLSEAMVAMGEGKEAVVLISRYVLRIKRWRGGGSNYVI